MTTNTPGIPDHSTETPDRASFLARSKKAIAGGVAGAVTAGGATLTTSLSDGKIDGPEWWVFLGSIVGGFLVAATAVWAAPANETDAKKAS